MEDLALELEDEIDINGLKKERIMKTYRDNLLKIKQLIRLRGKQNNFTYVQTELEKIEEEQQVQ
jgi:hypothetical protein